MDKRRIDRDVNIRLSIDNRETNERLERMEQMGRNTEINTVLLQQGQHVMVGTLNALLHYAGQHQAEVEALNGKIDALPDTAAADFDRINDLLETHFGALMEKMPATHDIVQAWKKANTKLPHEADSKWKLKFKLPFVFGEIEKEFSWDGKAALRLLRSELTAFSKGEKTLKELFIED